MKKSVLLLSSLLVVTLLAGCGPKKTPTKSSEESSDGSGKIISRDSTESSEPEVSYEDTDYHGKVKVYYHNDAGDYANKRIWAWQTGVDGVEYQFDNQTSPDEYGVYKIFDLSQAPWAGTISTEFCFIIKNQATWTGQSTDTICAYGRFKPFEEEGMITIYSCEGEGGNIDTYTKREDALGDRIGTAKFTDWRTLHIAGAGTQGDRPAAEVGLVSSYEIYAFDSSYYALNAEDRAIQKPRYLVKSGTGASTNEFDIKFDEDVLPYVNYTIEARMVSNPGKVKAKSASFTSLFDTPEFQKGGKYVYTGKDLGVSNATHESVTFKVWAPTSSRVQVRLYWAGTPGDLFDEFDASANWGSAYDMAYTDHGVWALTLEGDYLIPDEPAFYTYIVTNSAGTQEVIDPYAQSSGINGKRGTIVDWDELEVPEDFDKVASGQLLTDITSPNQLSVYEAHIRDLTMDSSWQGTSRRGTYSAFVESGTVYHDEASGKTVTTGFDHIAETGIKAVQLLPVFDQDNDERWLDAKDKPVSEFREYTKAEGSIIAKAPAYNWGYNPLNYNCVEGSYATNPFDGVSKIYEFRNLVTEFAKKDIRVIMDVVYNHFASINGNPLQKIVPDYYLRRTADGSYFDGTGVGNVTASERPMMSKFIVDSCVFWAEKYNIKGFRFDLMGCIDTETMKDVKAALYDVDPDIVVYGEGWSGYGGPGLSSKYKACSTENVYQELYDCRGKGVVGCFNDRFRDGMKGNTKDGDVTPAYGFLSQGSEHLNNETKARAAEGIIGANVDNKDSRRGMNPYQAVSYVACHDNYTLYDQLNYCIKGASTADIDDTTGDVFKACVAANAACFYNQGIAFLNGGDEIFRQKVMTPSDPMIGKMRESYAHKSDKYGSWIEGDGIELASGNWLVRNSYQYGDDVNSFKWDRKVKYYDYYLKMKEAIIGRNEMMSTLFGRSFDELKDHSINNVFNSTYDDGGKPLIADYLKGRNNQNYFIVLGGRMSGNVEDLGCGNCNIEVIYASTNDHTKGQKFTITNEKLGAFKYEFLVVRSY